MTPTMFLKLAMPGKYFAKDFSSSRKSYHTVTSFYKEQNKIILKNKENKIILKKKRKLVDARM